MASEEDTRANHIDPALKSAGWDATTIKRGHYFTDGRKLVGGRRSKRCYADYLLHKDNRNLALIEAKKEDAHPTKGLQQVIDYAKKLKVRFVYASNGLEIYEMDMQKGWGAFIEQYPNPSELIARYESDYADAARILRRTPFHLESGKTPYYFQELAVNAATDAIGKGDDRILLTLATGTGKTFIAFQIVHKLFQARWNRNELGRRRPRILFLADRNLLANQAKNTFNPYDKDTIKIDGDEIRRRNGVVPTNAHIFFAIYQAIADREDIGGYYKEYPREFFDLVIIDECHRGGANEAGSWRAILDHFTPAVHLGLTATPKREDNIDTYNYFGTPVYEYALKEGINDGFLTPYRVKRVRTNLDELILTEDDMILKGEAKKDLYELTDYDKTIIAGQRTELIAKAILENIQSLEKTIVFCVNQNHALSMRDMVNKHKTNRDPEYCVRVTSDEGKIGRDYLERFQNNDKDIPTILTSSQMLTTGVDARNVRNIVIDRNIGSMVEFKQIIGCGTRTYEGKDYFTIIDFRGATKHFYDPDWDGTDGGPDPDEPKDPSPVDEPPPTDRPGPTPPEEILTVQLSPSRVIKVIDVETRYVDENGRPLTAQQFIERLMFKLPDLFSSVEELRDRWCSPDEREVLLLELTEHGFDTEQLESLRAMFDAKDCDLFDLLAFLTHETRMHTRTERAEKTRNSSQLFARYDNEAAQAFLEFVLDKYEKTGVVELSRKSLANLVKLSGRGTITQLSQSFGGSAEDLLQAFIDIQYDLYHCI